VRSFGTGKGDFADSLIERIGADHECEYACTFDKQAAGAGMRLIE
jgi:predicted nucleic-acid-binding protein